MISLSNNNDKFSRPEIPELGWAVTDGGEIAQVRHADRRDHAVDVDDADAMLGGIEGVGGGKNSSESDTQGPARWAKVPLSLQTKVDGTCKGVRFAKCKDVCKRENVQKWN